MQSGTMRILVDDDVVVLHGTLAQMQDDIRSYRNQGKVVKSSFEKTDLDSFQSREVLPVPYYVRDNIRYQRRTVLK